ncbi:dolichyl-phosphate-mannose-protein mannosyltransferase [Nematocida sp. AWRm80]|nr:dolichyl-phosphate-mannose-protein mannosyltransferase [Nematocida sp. AWRm80]
MEIDRVRKREIEIKSIEDISLKKEKKTSISKRQKYNDALLIWLVSLIVRVFRIERGNFVIWDEAHFGKFSGYYLRKEFFFDVHPPLGKLLTALSAYLMGISKEYEFKSEDTYPSGVDYGGMRLFHALFGSFIPVIVYFIMEALCFKRTTRNVIAWSVVFDNALVSICRLILLDPFLILFVSLSELFLARVVMDNRKLDRISKDLVLLGVCIGLATSVKWIGLLTVAHVGFFAVFVLLAEIKNRNWKVILLFLRLSLCLILVPILVYVIPFIIHFKILSRTGPGDGEMSSRFQSYLENNEIHMNNTRILYGNRVSIRQSAPGIGLLHSHVDTYPDGGQQVTTYPHKDNNNHWRILKVGTDASDVQYNEDIVLHHLETNRYIYVTDKQGIISNGKLVEAQSQEEMNNTIKYNTVFQIIPLNSKDTLAHTTSKFYLKNKMHNCYLSYSGKKLPKWGHQQGEIVCIPKITANSIWNIEMNKIEETSPEYTPPEIHQSRVPSPLEFLKNLVEINLTMNAANNALVGDGNDQFGTQPYQWLFPKKWLKFTSWTGNSPRFAMLGNPVTWYLASANIPFLVFYAFNVHTKKYHSKNKYLSRRAGQVYILLGGWILHFFPFFLLSRILYLHHYLSSLLLSMMSLGIVLDRYSKIAYLYIVICIGSFVYFSPITYGTLLPLTSLPGYSIPLLRNWNIYRE